MNYPDDFHNKIIQGDCLDVMPFIPDKSINLVIADPPFCIGTTSNGQKGEWLDNNLIKPFLIFISTRLKEC
jgi:site-specific DNA-methyltransferase (adenine-specific)